jgi:hypothetical protein
VIIITALKLMEFAIHIHIFIHHPQWTQYIFFNNWKSRGCYEIWQREAIQVLNNNNINNPTCFYYV